MAKKKARRGPPAKLPEVMETVEQRLEEIHSDEAVIADAQHKQSAAGLPSAAEPVAEKYTYRRRSGRLPNPPKVDKDDDDDNGIKKLFTALKRHAVGNDTVMYSHTSNVNSKDIYTIGITKSGEGFLFIYDHGDSAMMKFTPKALEELKWRIDDVLVELGLNSIGVKSANEHMFRSSPRRE